MKTVGPFSTMTHVVWNDIGTIGHFTVVDSVAKPLIWSEAEGDLVVTETSI